MWFDLTEQDAELIKDALNYYKGSHQKMGHPRINAVADKLRWKNGKETLGVGYHEVESRWGNMSQKFINSWGRGGFGKLTPDEMTKNVQIRQQKFVPIFKHNSSN
jgi:hypothetical protein